MMCQEVRDMIDRDGAPTTGDANAHLHDCPSCAEFWATWQEVRKGLHGLGEEEAPPFLHTRLMAHVREAAEADSKKKEAWFFGLRKIWAGPLLVLFLGMLLGGYGLVQVWRPKPAAPPMNLDETARLAAPAKDKLATSESDAQRQAPARPASQTAPSLTGGGAPVEVTEPEPSPKSTEEALEKETSTAGSAKTERTRDDSLFASPEAAEGKKGNESPYQPLANRAQGEAAEGGSVSGTLQESRRSNAPAPSASRIEVGASAPAPPAMADDQGPAEVVCTLSPLTGSGPFITLQLPTGAAPPSGGIWTIQVPQDGPLRVLDALGKPVQASLPTVSAVLRPLHIPAGSYKLKRIS